MHLDKAYLRQQAQAVLGRSVSGLQVLPLAGDASTRNYYRLLPENSASRSLVLMELRDDAREQGQLFCRQQELFARLGLPVPQLYGYEQERGFIFLEDCGDLSLQQLVNQRGMDAAYSYYKQAVDWVLQLQAGTARFQGEYPAYHWAFDIPKLTQELDFFLFHLVERLREQTITPAKRQQFKRYFHELAAVLAREPRCLAHRDYHSRNLMIKDGQLKILDFQDARLGLCQYDLASLLRDSYVVLPQEMIDELLEYYLAQGKALQLPQQETESFQRLFVFTCIQRNLKALGTFAYQAVERRNPDYLPYIPPTLEYLRTSLSRYPDWIGLRDLLGRYLPEVRG